MSLTFRGPANNTAKLLWDSATDFNKGTLSANLEVSGSGDAAVIRPVEAADNNNDINFTTTADYTASAATIAVTGGQATLVEGLPVNGAFYAKYGSSIDADFSLGTGTGTAAGGASVSGGKLVLTSSDLRYVDYAGTGNANFAQTGCFRFKVTPNYTGVPAASKTFFCVSEATNDITNLIQLTHSQFSSGILELAIYSSSNSAILEFVSLGVWSPTSGTEYEFELNYDITAGATRLFINGTQHGSTQTATGTRNTTIGLLRIGSDRFPDNLSNFSIDNFLVFSTVQHTSNYTPDDGIFYPTTDNLYVETEDASQIAPSSVVSWLTATFTSSAPTNTDIRVLLSTDDRATWKTWNGSAWVAPNSATTRTDATTPADVVANIASLGVGSGLLDVRVFLRTSDGLDTPTVSNINVTSDAGYATSGTFTTNVADSGIETLDWDKLSLATVTPSGTTITVKATASNSSSSLSPLSSNISNQASVGVSGRYLQLEVTFSGTAAARPILHAVGVTCNPTVVTVSP